MKIEELVFGREYGWGPIEDGYFYRGTEKDGLYRFAIVDDPEEDGVPITMTAEEVESQVHAVGAEGTAMLALGRQWEKERQEAPNA
jgi:hypothetical protein